MENTDRGIGRPSEIPLQYHRGKNYFLGIGIDDYSKPFNRLRNCVNDITKVHAALLEMYDFEKEHTLLLFNEAASRKGILKKLRDILEKVTEHDSLIFMYSGHGDNLDSSNIGFMIPADAADEEDFINLSDIKSRLDAAKAKHIFVIFDACFSGLLLTQRDARAQNLPENFPSRYAMTSGRNHPVDDGEGEHSPFAKALIDELRENDDSIGSVMLAQKILDRFRRTGKDDDQLPAFGRISSDIEYEGQYYFYPKNYELSAARERTKRLEAEQARHVAEQALITAERERKRAEKLVRAATNAAAFLQARDTDPTLAMRMMQYNWQRHPENKLSHAMYHKLLVEDTPFLYKILRGHKDSVKAVCFSPNGQFLATGSQDSTVKIWSTTTRRCLQTLEGHIGVVCAVTYTPDGKYLITACDDNLVRLWSIETGKISATFKIKEGIIYCLAVSPDGQYVAVGCSLTGTEIWSIEKRKRVKILAEKDNEVRSIAYSADGKYIAVGGSNGLVHYWDIEAGTFKPIGYDFMTEFPITCIALSPNGKYLATGTETCNACIWSLSDGKCLHECWGHMYPIYTIAYSPSGEFLITGSSDGTAIIWDQNRGTAYRTFKSQHGEVNSIVFSTDEKYIAMGYYDHTAIIWHINKAPEVRSLGAKSERGMALNLQISADGQYLASSHQNEGESKIVNLWSLDTDDIVKSFNHEEESITHMGFSPNGQYVALGGESKIFLYSVKTGKVIKTFDVPDAIISGFIFLNNNSHFIVTTLDYKAALWSIETGTVVQTFVEGEQYINAITVTADDKYLITGSEDGSVKFWSIETGMPLKTFDTDYRPIQSVAISADSKYIAAGCTENSIFLWSIETGALLSTLIGHQGYIEALAFSADGQYLASGSSDKTAKLWSFSTFTLIKTFVGHASAIRSLVWTIDNKCVITGDEDGAIKFWNIATDGIEDRTATYTLFEMMDSYLEIEPEDSSQYIDELIDYIELTNMDKEDAVFKAKLHPLDASVGVELRRRLGLKG
jgi:WD40 repeat protein